MKTSRSFVGNANRQRIERDEAHIRNKREELKLMSSNLLVQFLKGFKQEDIKVTSCKDTLKESGHGLSGIITIKCKSLLNEEYFEKEYEVAIDDDAIMMPKEDAVIAGCPIAKAVKSTVTESILIPEEKNLKMSSSDEVIINNIIISAEANIVNLLKKLQYENVKSYKDCKMSLDKKANTFTGMVEFFISVIDKKGEKKLRIPVVIDKSSAKMPDVSIIQKEIAKCSTTEEIIEEEEDKKVSEYEKKIDEEEKFKEEETLKTLHFVPNAVNSSEESLQNKKADLNNVGNFVCRTLKINKTVMPEETKVGDIIDVEGLKYKVTDDSEGKISAAGTGSYFTLVLVDSNEKEDAKI
jgi:hypothetical protein